jgi:hypothetical protein
MKMVLYGYSYSESILNMVLPIRALQCSSTTCRDRVCPPKDV